MKDRHFPRDLTLLLELTAAVTVFAVAVAVCCLILARAERTSREAAKLEEAVAAITSAAESLRAAEDPEEVLWDIAAHPSLEAEVTENEGLTLYRLRWLEEGAEVWALELALAGEVTP